MIELIDALGREVKLKEPAKRVVSCVPSISELIWDLGGGESLIGCTKFCIYPEHLRSYSTVVGGTKNLQLVTIRDLKPDLVIGIKEENKKEALYSLAEDFPVYIGEVVTLNDALDMIRDIGKLLGKEDRASKMAESIEKDTIEWKKLRPVKRKKVFYLIWKNPWMVAGGDTFIHHCLDWGGWDNAAVELSRYPVISLEDMIKQEPEEIFLSSEPYPFVEEDQRVMEEIFPHAKVRRVDGSLFSWYGSRMLRMRQYFESLHF
jgi:ABC-type Fe3+-hydroxamate transport system substrate-binding protein